MRPKQRSPAHPLPLKVIRMKSTNSDRKWGPYTQNNKCSEYFDTALTWAIESFDRSFAVHKRSIPRVVPVEPFSLRSIGVMILISWWCCYSSLPFGHRLYGRLLGRHTPLPPPRSGKVGPCTVALIDDLSGFHCTVYLRRVQCISTRLCGTLFQLCHWQCPPIQTGCSCSCRFTSATCSWRRVNFRSRKGFRTSRASSGAVWFGVMKALERVSSYLYSGAKKVMPDTSCRRSTQRHHQFCSDFLQIASS